MHLYLLMHPLENYKIKEKLEMNKTIYDPQNGLTYEKVGDYYLSLLVADESQRSASGVSEDASIYDSSGKPSIRALCLMTH